MLVLNVDNRIKLLKKFNIYKDLSSIYQRYLFPYLRKDGFAVFCFQIQPI